MTDYFRVLIVDLAAGKSRSEMVEGRSMVAGGSGLAALLFKRYGQADLGWDHPAQPFILGVGPLTGHFPLMSKTVCAFRSPYHNQYTESHGGGRSALAVLTLQDMGYTNVVDIEGGFEGWVDDDRSFYNRYGELKRVSDPEKKP